MEISKNISVKDFLGSIENSKRQQDGRALVELMEEATGATPQLWGTIIGFGTHHYKYETGREGDTIAVGFSPRKAALVIYGIVECDQTLKDVPRLGNYTLSKSCLYVRKLEDIDLKLLQTLIAKAFIERNNV